MRNGPLLIVALLAFWPSAVDAQPVGEQPSAMAQEEPPGETILGAPSAFDLGEPPELLRVEAGTAIRSRPERRAPVLERLGFATELPVEERRDSWVLVRRGSLKGWVWTLADEAQEPAQQAVGFLVAEGPASEDLARARAYLGADAVEAKLGPYRLFTDVDRPRLLERLASLAQQLPTVFRQRYGLSAEPAADETVVLYDREESYADYVENETEASLHDSAGRALDGLAVLAVGSRPANQVGSLLVHELTHLLTYRAFAVELPFWLSEGLAEDLAMSRIDGSGELMLGTLASWQSVSGMPSRGAGPRGRWVSGPEIALAGLREAWNQPRRPSLATLLQLSRQGFTEPGNRSLNYWMSAFWVRYLLAEHGAAFRAFLANVAKVGGADAAVLGSHLGLPWDDLEEHWGFWLRGQGPWKKSGAVE